MAKDDACIDERLYILEEEYEMEIVGGLGEDEQPRCGLIRRINITSHERLWDETTHRTMNRSRRVKGRLVY
jgi:hypothetical protein